MAVYYFDANGATAGFGTLTGAWDTTTALWTTSSAGTSATSAVTFTNADSARFGFAGTSATAGTATIATGVTVTLNALLSANLSGTQTVAASGTGALVFSGTTPSITAGSTGGLLISAPITATSGLTINNASSSTKLTLTNNSNNFSGGTVTLSPLASFSNADLTVSDNIFSAPGNGTSLLNAGSVVIGANQFVGSFCNGNAFTANAALSGSGLLIVYSQNTTIGPTFGAGALSGMTGNSAPYASGTSSIFPTSGFCLYSEATAFRKTVYATVNDFPLTGNTQWLAELSSASQACVIKYIGAGGTYNGPLYALVRNLNNMGTATVGLYANGSAPLTLTGAFTRDGLAGTMTFRLGGSNTGNNTLSGVISETGGALAFNKVDAGKWVLTGNNTFTGGVTVSAGTLALGATSGTETAALAKSIYTPQAGLVFDTGITSALVGGIPAATNIALPSNFTLKVGNNNASVVYSAVLSGDATALFAKVGSGTYTLTGTNTNTGAYTVSAGTLRIGNAGTTGTLGNGDASNASVASGATLAFGRSDARTYSNIISGAGTIAVNGGGRTTLSGVNTFTSAAAAIAISTANSILRVTNNDSIGQGTTFGITVASGTAFEIDGTSGNLTGLPAKVLALNSTGISSGGGLRNIAGDNTYSGVITLSGSSRINSDAGTLALTSASSITGSGFALSFGGASNITVNQAIATAAGTVTKDGAGFTELKGVSSYTGVTTVSAGTLGYTTAAAAGSASSFGQPAADANAIVGIAGNAVAASAGGIRFTGTADQTFSRTVNITGTNAAGLAVRIEASSNTAKVTHAAAFTNTTTNQPRTYQFGGTGTTLNTVSFLVANNGTGAVGITKAEAGRWVLSNTGNTYTGATTVNAGTLGLSVATWAAGAKVTSTSTVIVHSGAKIQTFAGSGGSAQLGRHTYSNLTFAANGRIRIGG